MTNWYKKSDITIENFSDRNIVNEKIHTFEEFEKELMYLTKLAFQNGKLAKEINSKIMLHQSISSYPKIKKALSNADQVALDSPWKFSIFCKEAASFINEKIRELKKERNDFTDNNKTPKVMKGWVD